MCSPLFPRHATLVFSLSLSLSLPLVERKNLLVSTVDRLQNVPIHPRESFTFFFFSNTLAVYFEKMRVSLCGRGTNLLRSYERTVLDFFLVLGTIKGIKQDCSRDIYIQGIRNGNLFVSLSWLQPILLSHRRVWSVADEPTLMHGERVTRDRALRFTNFATKFITATRICFCFRAHFEMHVVSLSLNYDRQR